MKMPMKMQRAPGRATAWNILLARTRTISLSRSAEFTEHSIGTGVKLSMMSKVQYVFCFESCTTEGRGGKREGEPHRTFDIRINFYPCI